LTDKLELALYFFILGQVKKLGNNIIFVKKSYRNTRHKIITEHISSRADEIF